MGLFSQKPPDSLEAAMNARPVRVVAAELTKRGGGGGSIVVQMQPPRWARWFAKYPQSATKTYEFDEIGALVWQQIDGKTTVQQIVREVAAKYRLNLREAQVPTVQFLKTLIVKGLVGIPVAEDSRAAS